MDIKCVVWAFQTSHISSIRTDTHCFLKLPPNAMGGVEQKHRDKNATFSVTARNISTCENRNSLFLENKFKRYWGLLSFWTSVFGGKTTDSVITCKTILESETLERVQKLSSSKWNMLPWESHNFFYGQNKFSVTQGRWYLSQCVITCKWRFSQYTLYIFSPCVQVRPTSFGTF